jgi:hypothetical protein
MTQANRESGALTGRTGLRALRLSVLATSGLLAICLAGLVVMPLQHNAQLYPDAMRSETCSKPIVKAGSRGSYLDLYMVYEACLVTDDRPKRVIEWYAERGWKVVLDGIAATGTTTRILGPLRYTSVKAVVSIRRQEPTTVLVRQGFRIEIKIGK